MIPSRVTKNSIEFRQMVDDIIGFTDYDPELASGIKWLDKTDKLGDMDFYDKVFECLYRREISEKAKKWNEER